MQSSLTRADEDVMVRAHLLTRLKGSEAIRRHTGEHDPLLAYALLIGEAQYLLAELAAIVNRIRADEQ